MEIKKILFINIIINIIIIYHYLKKNLLNYYHNMYVIIYIKYL